MNEEITVFIVAAAAVVFIIVLLGAMRKSQRYHKSRQGADQRNLDEYGSPALSLYTEAKLFSLHNIITITDENDQPVYKAHSKVLSLHDKTWLETASGQQVAYIWSKVFSLHERHFVEMADGVKFQLSNELLHLIKDITNIEEFGWTLEGNIAALNFVLKDASERPVAVVGQKLFSVHDKFSIDIYQPQYEDVIVAIVVTLQHMLRDRRNASSSGSSSSSSSS